MMNDLDDIAAWNVQSASTTTPTTNNTPAGTNPAVNTTTPTNMTGVTGSRHESCRQHDDDESAGGCKARRVLTISIQIAQ